MGAAPVRRSGFEAHEALIKNQFFRKRLVEGGAENIVFLQEPVSLGFGKGAHAIHQACMTYWRALRQLGHVASRLRIIVSIALPLARMSG